MLRVKISLEGLRWMKVLNFNPTKCPSVYEICRTGRKWNRHVAWHRCQIYCLLSEKHQTEPGQVLSVERVDRHVVQRKQIHDQAKPERRWRWEKLCIAHRELVLRTTAMIVRSKVVTWSCRHQNHFSSGTGTLNRKRLNIVSSLTNLNVIPPEEINFFVENPDTNKMVSFNSLFHT